MCFKHYTIEEEVGCERHDRGIGNGTGWVEIRVAVMSLKVA